MEAANKINVYVCESCKHEHVTVNAVAGTTPFMIRCRRNNVGCDDTAMAQSQFYRVDQNRRPDWEWYKPEEGDPILDVSGVADHVRQGGLMLRKLDAGGRERYGYSVRAG